MTLLGRLVPLRSARCETTVPVKVAAELGKDVTEPETVGTEPEVVAAE